MASFFGTTGGMGKEALIFYFCLVDWLSHQVQCLTAALWLGFAARFWGSCDKR